VRVKGVGVRVKGVGVRVKGVGIKGVGVKGAVLIRYIPFCDLIK
jgi:hypothetical protein